MAFNAPAKRPSEARPLRGTEKVAALLLAMGRELSGGVLREFDPDEIRLVTRAAAELKPISAPELEAIIDLETKRFAQSRLYRLFPETGKCVGGVQTAP